MSVIANEGTKDYRVCSSMIYAGRVVKSNNKSHLNINLKDTYFFEDLEDYRSELFVIDGNGQAIDLLYRSPLYPVIGHADTKLIDKSPIVVKDAVCLGAMVDGLGLNFLFHYYDAVTLKNILFSGYFLKYNLGLFGLDKDKLKMNHKDLVLFDEDNKLTDQFKGILTRLEQLIKVYGYESVSDLVVEGKLPLEYIIAIDSLSKVSELSKSKSNIFRKVDSFSRVKEEGPVKKLKYQ